MVPAHDAFNIRERYPRTSTAMNCCRNVMPITGLLVESVHARELVQACQSLTGLIGAYHRGICFLSSSAAGQGATLRRALP
jgi:hypothetical protein